MRITLLILLVLLMAGCCNSISQKDLQEYLQKHELLQEKSVNEVNYKVSLLSNNLMADQIIGNIKYSQKVKDSIKNSIQGNLYLMAEISQNGNEVLAQNAGTNNYRNIIDEFEFGIGEKVKLITEQGDTLKLYDYSFPRTYGLSSASKIIFVFAKPEFKNSDFTEFYIDDFGLETGKVKFRFKNKNIQRFLEKRINKQNK